jgi:hypothetical protein
MTAPDSVPLHALAEDNLATASPDRLRAMVKIPKLWQGGYFPHSLLERRRRAEQVAAIRNQPLEQGAYACVRVAALTQTATR